MQVAVKKKSSTGRENRYKNDENKAETLKVDCKGGSDTAGTWQVKKTLNAKEYILLCALLGDQQGMETETSSSRYDAASLSGQQGAQGKASSCPAGTRGLG